LAPLHREPLPLVVWRLLLAYCARERSFCHYILPCFTDNHLVVLCVSRHEAEQADHREVSQEHEVEATGSEPQKGRPLGIENPQGRLHSGRSNAGRAGALALPQESYQKERVPAWRRKRIERHGAARIFAHARVPLASKRDMLARMHRVIAMNDCGRACGHEGLEAHRAHEGRA